MSDKDNTENNDDKLLYCSFCGKNQNEVRKLIAGPSVYICNECIDLCNDIIKEEISESTEVIYEEPQIVMIEEAEPIFISGEDMVNGLWGPSSELAKQIGRDRYEIMYVVYEANKENFIDNNINQPMQDGNFIVDLSLIENLNTDFVIDEVKRHIFCSC